MHIFIEEIKVIYSDFFTDLDQIVTPLGGEIITKGLNVTQSERYIDTVLSGKNRDKFKNQKTRLVIKDIKILENTINKAVESIRSTGIDAVTSQTETEDYIEYKVRIPKNKGDSEPIRPSPSRA